MALAGDARGRSARAGRLLDSLHSSIRKRATDRAPRRFVCAGRWLVRRARPDGRRTSSWVLYTHADTDCAVTFASTASAGAAAGCLRTGRPPALPETKRSSRTKSSGWVRALSRPLPPTPCINRAPTVAGERRVGRPRACRPAHSLNTGSGSRDSAGKRRDADGRAATATDAVSADISRIGMAARRWHGGRALCLRSQAKGEAKGAT